MFKLKVTIYVVIAALSFHSIQGQNPLTTNFDENDLAGVTNIDGGIAGLSAIPFPPPNENFYLLEKICNGTNTAEGYMTVQKELSPPYNGIYPYGGALEVGIENENDFNIYLRVGFTGGSDGTIIISTGVQVIPAFSVAYENSFDMRADYFTVLSGNSTVLEVLASITKMRVIHSTVGSSYDGAITDGVLRLTHVRELIIIISVEDEIFRNLILFPNPANALLSISSEVPVETYRIHSAVSALVSEGIIEIDRPQIDVSNLKTGMYFIEFTSGNKQTTKKFIKQ